MFDVSRRVELAKKEAKVTSILFSDAFFDTSKVKYDEPIPNTAVFLNMLVNKTGVEIVYLSGRRTDLMKETRKALNKHGYPYGIVVLRGKGRETLEFKYNIMTEMREKYEIRAFITDEEKELSIGEELSFPSVKVEKNKEWSQGIRKHVMELSL